MSHARLLAIGTASPAHMISPSEGKRVAEALTPSIGAARIEHLYDTCGVASRGSILSAKDLIDAHVGLDGGLSTELRLSGFVRPAAELAERASRDALQRARIDPSDIRHLVTVSCTGAHAPGVDLTLIDRLGFRRGVSRTHVGFMGCHGAINALRVADGLVRAPEGGMVLVVCIELCSMHYQSGEVPYDQAIANAIFADGAAAAIVAPGQRKEGRRILGFDGHAFENTSSLMRWRVTDHGFAMHLSPRVPSILGRSITRWIAPFLAEHTDEDRDALSWAVHPGGRDILTAVRKALDLSDEALAASASVLERCGNMSSPTVLWVLEQLHRAHPGAPTVAMAFGPGLVGEAMMLAPCE